MSEEFPRIVTTIMFEQRIRAIINMREDPAEFVPKDKVEDFVYHQAPDQSGPTLDGFITQLAEALTDITNMCGEALTEK